MMIVQIYEVGNPKEALLVAQAGADHIGVLVGDGDFPREIPIPEAQKIFDAVPQSTKKVALSLASDWNRVHRIVLELNPDILHLGCPQNAWRPRDIQKLKAEFQSLNTMRTIPVVDEQSIHVAKQYDGVADFLLLDTYRSEDDQLGATGLVHDWELSKRIVESVRIPVILAGGLGPENVRAAILQVRPAGVDSKTRTDRAGTHEKDIEKVKRFAEIARNI